jgi:hypothetical protein
MCIGDLPACVCVYHVHLQCPKEVREEGIQCHRTGVMDVVWAMMWVLGINARAFSRATRALNHWAITPAPVAYVLEDHGRRLLASSFLHLLVQYLSTFLWRVASGCCPYYLILRQQSRSFVLVSYLAPLTFGLDALGDYFPISNDVNWIKIWLYI